MTGTRPPGDPDCRTRVLVSRHVVDAGVLAVLAVCVLLLTGSAGCDSGGVEEPEAGNSATPVGRLLDHPRGGPALPRGGSATRSEVGSGAAGGRRQPGRPPDRARLPGPRPGSTRARRWSAGVAHPSSTATSSPVCAARATASPPTWSRAARTRSRSACTPTTTPSGCRRRARREHGGHHGVGRRADRGDAAGGDRGPHRHRTGGGPVSAAAVPTGCRRGPGAGRRPRTNRRSRFTRPVPEGNHQDGVHATRSAAPPCSDAAPNG
ncbi:hypothetical protein SCYAM73S_04064 [Streptomyces cyaneofuscatus]